MMSIEDKSPGQVAYEAYYQRNARWPHEYERARQDWEAAAQAVLRHPANMGEEVNRQMQSTLDAVTRELEVCRNMLVDIWDNCPTRCETCLQSVARVDERIEQSFLERVEAADAALGKAKQAKGCQ